MVSRVRGKGKKGVVQGATECVLQDEKVPEICCTATCIQLTLLYCTVKIVKMLNYVFYHKKSINNLIKKKK